MEDMAVGFWVCCWGFFDSRVWTDVIVALTFVS